jgi:hypothetical protein
LNVFNRDQEKGTVANQQQWPKIKQIVGAALEHDPSEQAAFLDQACSQDIELRAEVESLLAAHADADGLSESFWVAVQGKRTQALSLIQDALDHGLALSVAIHIEDDEDLKLLHGDPKFEAILASIRERAKAAQQTN